MKQSWSWPLALFLAVAMVGAAQARPKVALVLSGGGARGLAHIGVLKELERQRVPYDCIVGTSMGAIAGGAFATGMSVAEAERRVVAADWRNMFNDRPHRSDVPYFRKEDDWKDYFDFSLTLDGLKLQPPRNFIGVQNIALFFRELTGAQYSRNFDELPLPYRAIGTDISNGDAVIIKDGTVATAMRSSMSVPGVFPPIKYEDRLLVDGGIAKNIPVDVGRELCGEKVIVVNVSTPVAEEGQLGSFLSIGLQVVSISMQRNMDEQLKQITPDDVLIVPALDGYTSADFEKVRELIALGEQATRKAESELKRFAVPEAEYQEWQAAIQARKQPKPVVSEVEMLPTRWVDPRAMSRLLDVHLNQPFDMNRLHQNIAGVYARGDFTSILYDLQPRESGDGARLVIKPQEKPGRDFLRFGLKLESDFDTSSDFGVLAALRRVWLNRFDAEWTTGVEIGSDQRAYSEWFQPLAWQGEFFLAPYAEYNNTFRDLVVQGEAVSEYRVTKYGGGLELGSTIGRWGQVRLGAYEGRVSYDQNLGLDFGQGREKHRGYTLRAIYDQIDNPRFPYEGGALHLNGFASEQDWRWLELDARKAFTFGPNSILLATRLGYAMDTELPIFDNFYLGGLFNLSAFRQWALFGNNLVYGRLQFSRQLATLPSFVGRGLYGGGMLEAGDVLDNAQMRDLDLSEMKYSGGLYVAADTRIGPLYLAGSRGSDGQSAFYLAIGARY